MTARLTEDSLRTHGVLTHPLTEDSRLEVEGKGDRKWKGVRAEDFHHDYRKVDVRDVAPIVAPSPVTTPDAMMSLTAIEHLDFEPEVPCEHSQHASGRYGHHGPGWALVELDCPCGRGGRYVACRSWWLLLCSSGRAPRCGICGTRATVGVTLRIVQVLR